MTLPLLHPAPTTPLREGGGFELGSFRGPLGDVDYRGVSSAWQRLRREKRWLWYSIVQEPWIIAFAVVRTGYASNCFAFVQNLEERRFAAQATRLGGPTNARVERRAYETHALFAVDGVNLLRVDSVQKSWSVSVDFTTFQIDAECTHDASPVVAIAKVPGGTVNATEKGVGSCLRGTLRVPGHDPVDLSGAVAGYDFTHGLLGRRTSWRWAFGLGKDHRGKPIGVNVVSGFVGQTECVTLGPGGPSPLAEPSFQFDASNYDRAWRIHGDGIDLRADIHGLHEERKRLVVVRSDFLQAAAILRGTVAGLGDVRLLGVVEDQDIVW